MKKTVTFCLLLSTLYAYDDYTPVSEISNDKKVEYNFMNSNKTVNKEVNKKEEFQPVKSIKNIETKKEILQEEKIPEIKENSSTVDKNFIKDYKKDNILQDTKKYTDNTNDKDFGVSTKVAYIYLSTEATANNLGTISDKTSEVLPEISFRYKNNIIKSDILKSSLNDKETGFKLDTTWYKIAYLYRYLNADIGFAYNKVETKSSFLSSNSEKDTEEFPSIELNLKNIDHLLQAQYGVSYGRNNDIDAYEYYLNLGYRVFNNESLVLIAGYKNKTIEDDDLKVEYKGPIIGITSTF